MNKVISVTVEKLKSKQNYLLAMGLSFVLGIILGFSLKSENENKLFLENTVNFFVIILSKEGNPFKLLFIRLLSDCGFFIMFAIFGRIVFTYIIQFIFIIFRGYVLGVAAVTFTLSFGVLGVITFIFAILIQNVITTIGLSVFSALALETIENSKKCANFNYNNYFLALLIGFIIAIIGVIFESLIIVIIIKPTITYF